MIRLILIFLIFCGLTAYAQDKDEERFGKHVLIGKEVPKFTGKTLEDEIFDLSKYIGRPIIIDFWSVSCRYCMLEMPVFERLRKEYPEILVININSF